MQLPYIMVLDYVKVLKKISSSIPAFQVLIFCVFIFYFLFFFAGGGKNDIRIYNGKNHG